MTVIKEATFSKERALYNLRDAYIKNCRFEGEEDGESAMKESANLRVEECYFDLRYPLWHVKNASLSRDTMTENCRAALWYDTNVTVENCVMNGIKALRECKNVTLSSVRAVSPEFGWKCKNVRVVGGSVQSEYAFLLTENLTATGLDFVGKYSFQYVKNAKFSKCSFDTKDAFWHTENVTVKDSVIKGEYLGWYSKNLTLIRCKIVGTQPLCYCKGLKLIDCETENCDLSFEYSEVKASVKGEILSVKNPRAGKIVADKIGEIILKDSVMKTRAKILVRSAVGKNAETKRAGSLTAQNNKKIKRT